MALLSQLCRYQVVTAGIAMQSTGSGRAAAGIHKAPVHPDRTEGRGRKGRGRGRGSAYPARPPGVAFHRKTVAPSEAAAASHLAKQMAQTTLEKNSDPVSSSKGRLSSASESCQPHPLSEPVVRNKDTPSETPSSHAQARPLSGGSTKSEQYTLEWELADAKAQLDKDLATLTDPEEICLKIVSEIDRFIKREQILRDGWLNKVNDCFRPYYAKALLPYLNRLREEVNLCRGQGHYRAFLTIIAHARLLNHEGLDYTPREYVDRVADVLRDWIKIELDYLRFRENWSDKRGVEWGLNGIKLLLSEKEPCVYLGILGQDEIKLFKKKLTPIGISLKYHRMRRVIADSELVQSMARGDLQECDRLLWKEAHPDLFFQRMLGDLLSCSIDEANEEFSGRKGRSIEQAIGFLKTLFLFSRDYAQSFARIPRLESRMFNLLSAVVYELLKKSRAQRHEGYTLDPIVISIIDTLLDQKWLDNDCCRLWQEYNAPEPEQVRESQQGRFDEDSINNKLDVFFRNKQQGRARYAIVKALHEGLSEAEWSRLDERTKSRIRKAEQVIFADEFEKINRKGINATRKFGWASKDAGKGWDYQGIINELNPLKKQCLEVADYAFLLKKENRDRWERTFCSVLGRDVQSVANADAITPEHMQTFSTLRNYVPTLPDDNTRGWVKKGIANMLYKAMSRRAGQYCGTPQQVDALCEWYESEIPAGNHFEKRVNGQVEKLIKRWREIKVARSAASDKVRVHSLSTPTMPPGSTATGTVRYPLPDLIPDQSVRHQPEVQSPPGPEQPVHRSQETAGAVLPQVIPQAGSDHSAARTPQPAAVKETGVRVPPMGSQPPRAVVPPVVVPRIVATPVVTQKVVTPQVVTPQVITPQVITPQVITPQVITPQVVTPQVVMAVQPGWLVQRYLIAPASMLTNDLIEGIKRIEASVQCYLDIVAQGQVFAGAPFQRFREEMNRGCQYLCQWLGGYCRDQSAMCELSQTLSLLAAREERGEIDRKFDEMISAQVRTGNIIACDELIRIRDCLFQVRRSLDLPVNRI